MMQTFFEYLTIAVLIFSVLPLYRLIKGPTVFDRMLGAGAIATKTMLLILIIGYVYDRIDMFIDLTLAYAILNFIGTLAVAKYIGIVQASDDKEV
jgi:multicomponent Na+:H+ antiporter subunit F